MIIDLNGYFDLPVASRCTLCSLPLLFMCVTLVTAIFFYLEINCHIFLLFYFLLFFFTTKAKTAFPIRKLLKTKTIFLKFTCARTPYFFFC